MTDQEITLVIADNRAVVRKGLRLLLDAEPGLRVVAQPPTIDGPPHDPTGRPSSRRSRRSSRADLVRCALEHGLVKL